MPIPHVVYQTWRYATLPPKVAGLTAYMQRMMPSFEFRLYDDAAVEAFIRNYSEDADDNDILWATYCKLTIGAAKADFWRYLVLYKMGGVYLDVDAIIIQPLDELLRGVACHPASTPHPQGIITRETNDGIFNNWILAFEPGHPFMGAMINYCCAAVGSVAAVTADNVLWTTGPLALSAVLAHVYEEGYNTYDDIGDIKVVGAGACVPAMMLYHMTDAEFAEKGGRDIGLSCYKTDMGEYARAKHRFAAALYNAEVTPYWRTCIK
jgi:mannosyltransferase OCH1-like enzyme